MPLHPPPLLRPALQPCLPLARRPFATSRALCHDHISSKNHYERLNVHHEASPAEIKKYTNPSLYPKTSLTASRSFYKLSKAHHPDANPHDPSASHIFSLLSESYTVLSDAARRAAYDRDILRLHHHQSHHPQKGSYHSAGGRPATGLSRRKGSFRGPPPSFYRAGGYGAHTEKHRRAREESTSSGGSESSPHGGMGPGDDPFGHHQDVPHFDRYGHHRTQRREDERRWKRTHKRAVDDENVEFEPQMSIGTHFMVVLGILTTSFAVPALYLRSARSGRRKKREA